MGFLAKLKNLFGYDMKTNEVDNLDNNLDNSFLNIFSETTKKSNFPKPGKKNRNRVTLIEQEEKILESLVNSTTNPQLQAIAQAIVNCDNVLNLLDNQGKPIDFTNPFIAQIMSQKFEFTPSFNVLNMQPPEILEKEDETEKDKKNQKNSLTMPDPILRSLDKTSDYLQLDVAVFVEKKIEDQLKTIIHELNNQRAPSEINLLKQTLASLIILKPKFIFKNILVDDEKNLLTLMAHLSTKSFAALLHEPSFLQAVQNLSPEYCQRLSKKVELKLQSTPTLEEQFTLLSNYVEVLSNSAQLTREHIIQISTPLPAKQRTKFLHLPKLKPLFSKAKKRNNKEVLNGIESRWSDLSVIPQTDPVPNHSLNNDPETTYVVNNINDLYINKTSKNLYNRPKLKPLGLKDSNR